MIISENIFVKYAYGASCGNGKLEERNDYYPFGGLMGKDLNGDFQSYKYNGKELERQISLDIYDYGVRRYDAATCRFTTMDPLAEKYYSTSPYAYCVNNPMRFVDSDGREWKNTQDKEIATRLQEKVADRDKSLAEQEQKINAQINTIGNNTKLSVEKRDKQITKQQEKLEDVQMQRRLLSNLYKGITQLGESKTVYTFNTVKSGTTATLSSLTDGTVVINNYGTIGSRAHEVTHAIQYDNGKITFNILGTNNTRMQNPDMLERLSYMTEYSITNGIVPASTAGSPRTVFGINREWLWGIKDPNTGIYIYTKL